MFRHGWRGLPKTKNGNARDVPLSSRAVATLEALPRNLDGRVFSTTYEGIHQSYVRACRGAGITGHKTLQMLK